MRWGIRMVRRKCAPHGRAGRLALHLLLPPAGSWWWSSQPRLVKRALVWAGAQCYLSARTGMQAALKLLAALSCLCTGCQPRLIRGCLFLAGYWSWQGWVGLRLHCCLCWHRGCNSRQWTGRASRASKMPAAFAVSPSMLQLTNVPQRRVADVALRCPGDISICTEPLVVGSTQVNGPVQGRHVLWGWLQERRKVGSYDYAGCLSVPRLLFIRDNRLVQVSRQSVGATILQRDRLSVLCKLMPQQAAACVHEAGPTSCVRSSLWS